MTKIKPQVTPGSLGKITLLGLQHTEMLSPSDFVRRLNLALSQFDRSELIRRWCLRTVAGNQSFLIKSVLPIPGVIFLTEVSRVVFHLPHVHRGGLRGVTSSA